MIITTRLSTATFAFEPKRNLTAKVVNVFQHLTPSAPPGLMSNHHSVLESAALEILQATFGYSSFRDAQAQIVTHVANGGDALVLMPTGGGKSLCYQLPALLRAGTAVVVSPLIALMQDQVDALRQLGIASAALNSTLDSAAQNALEMDLRRGRIKLLYVSPERLLTARLMALLGEIEVSLFAIDEAHCVSQWGHDFRPEYQGLSALHERFAHVPRIALTATADPATREEIKSQLKLDSAAVFVSSFDRPNIRLTLVPKDRPAEQLNAFLKSHVGESGIVYALSRKSVDETAQRLASSGVRALPYHAGMSAPERQSNQRRFVSEDGVVMVATVAFGMGIDKPDVRFVAHLDLPKSIEGYYQEIGRAGRDGGPAEAWLAYGLSDILQLKRFIDESLAPDARKRYERGQLDGLLAFAETAECRRIALLRHFGESYPQPCGNCDNCLDPPTVIDASVAAQKILSAIARTGQRFGAVHVINVVRGHKTELIEQYRHDQLKVYGIGAAEPELLWRALLRQLISRGAIEVEHQAYNALRLTDLARPILRGDEQVHVIQPRKKVKGIKADKTRTVTELNPAASKRYERLRTWRSTVAKEQSLPPYVIFHDRTLSAIAELNPTNKAALLKIPGIGETKVARYGESLLALLR